ncbi:hypothetical protein H4R21_005056 [Coemansia helicoidea]|uniref:Uncharacterized protein n=1 Tax=Coemansia helicoidea TaxID=1286919 RepID=A0ACC1KUI6_9FUNG|nr:hypothetical protein H4R21_005056 [Coemansia helicoidea]
MSFQPVQPVGERLRFKPHLPASAMRGSGEWLTPTRQGNATLSPFQTALRRSTFVESGKSANPFTPRADRALSAAGPHTLGRRNTVRSASLLAPEPVGGVAVEAGAPPAPLPGSASAVVDEYPPLGGVGSWPLGAAPAVLAAGLGAVPDGTDAGSRSPFARPKSPAPRSASPHRNSKQLPSFLLGASLAPKPPSSSALYSPDTARPSLPSATSPLFDISPMPTSAKSPMTAHPASPHFSRRLSGFGSNDMLSGAYRSSVAVAAAGVASSLDDAPPVMALDDLDADGPDGVARGENNDSGVAGGVSAGPFALPHGGAGARGGRPQQSAADDASSEQDYNDVRVRAVVVSDLPPGAESGAVNYFREFGEILAFSAVPAVAGRLALLFSEPWQAQQAIAQADGAGRILLGGRILTRVEWADAQCTSLLFRSVFPTRALPRSAAPPPADSLSFSEALYAQSPRKRPAPHAPAAGQPLLEAAQDSASKRRAGVGSPFRQHRQPAARPGPGAAASTVMASSDGLSGAVLKGGAAARPRNGLVQSALDILFGW